MIMYFIECLSVDIYIYVYTVYPCERLLAIIYLLVCLNICYFLSSLSRLPRADNSHFSVRLDRSANGRPT